MTPELQLGYLGVEVRDRAGFGTYLTDVVAPTPGEPTDDGFATWRNDGRAHRLLVAEGTSDDAVLVGFEAPNAAAFEATTSRLDAAGWPVAEAGAASVTARRVARLAWVDAPGGRPGRDGPRPCRGRCAPGGRPGALQRPDFVLYGTAAGGGTAVELVASLRADLG